MKKLIIFFALLIFFVGCTTEQITENITEKYNIENGIIEFCNYEILDTWCWDENDDIWLTFDLSNYTKGQAIIEVSLEFLESLDPRIDAANIYVRKNENSPELCIYGNDTIGSKILITDENGCIEWKHTMNVDITRKIHIKVYLTMIQK